MPYEENPLLQPAPPDPKALSASLTVQGAAGMVAAVIVPVILRRCGVAVPEDVQAAMIALTVGLIVVGYRRALGGLAALLLPMLLLAGCASYPDLRPTLPKLDRALVVIASDYDPAGAALIDSSTPAQRAELRANRAALIAQARATIAAGLGEGR